MSLVCNWVAGIQHINFSCSLTARKTEILQAPGGEAGLNDIRKGPWPDRWPLTVDLYIHLPQQQQLRAGERAAASQASSCNNAAEASFQKLPSHSNVSRRGKGSARHQQHQLCLLNCYQLQDQNFKGHINLQFLRSWFVPLT